ncbi:hypothetical protein [Allobranchiibius huperziae]|uniref:Integral membrane protein n=1 Tax=Allobranchiibius huperziae TaxID=1874116 RepID=A0A853DJI6_9MICO|nr:hypothetical protein [Allobranchiibius huperziae]NYJ74880.1 hypothetical protein [Allobranchiibius huperziae]
MVLDWWSHEIMHGHKLPLVLALGAFLVTFVTTRTITRLIRAGKGPFHNVASGGVHLHHSTPGTVLLVAGAFTEVGADGRSPGSYVGAALIGVGSSLVLDEFAMIFHLQDVYWSQEGQLSVTVVSLTAACVALAVVGVSPTGVTGLSPTARFIRGGLTTVLVIHLVCEAVTALKGKIPTALISLFLGPFAWYAAVRIARPRSPWAKWFYGPHRMERASRHTQEFDDHWYPVRRHWDDFIGGAPSVAGQPARRQQTR